MCKVEERTPTFQLADMLLPEGLPSFVAERRAAGRSWRRLARDIYDATDQRIDVSFETLRGWFSDEAVAS